MASHILRRGIGSRSGGILPGYGVAFLSSSAAVERAFSSQAPIRATLFPGDGIGPEIADSVKQVRSSSILLPNFCLQSE